MKTLYYNLFAVGSPFWKFFRYLFKKKEPPTIEPPTEEEIIEIESSPEFQEFLKALEETDVKLSEIPFICPDNTALFATLDPDKSRINYLNEFYYRRNIRNAYKYLRKLNYTTFIVNAGTQYGMLAMEELLKIKNYGSDFRIYCATITKERRSLLHNFLHEALMMGSCDKQFEVFQPAEYAKNIVQRVSVICTEKNVLFTQQNIPPELRKYYERFIKRLREEMSIKKTFDTYIYGNNRTIHNALYSLPNHKGTFDEIMAVYPKFKRSKAQKALDNLIVLGLVRFLQGSNEYEIIPLD